MKPSRRKAPADTPIALIGTYRYSGFKPWMGVPVSTSVGANRAMGNIDEIDALKPWGIYRENDWDVFEPAYRAMLDARADEIRADLQSLTVLYPGQWLTLLCYEDIRRPGVWCHRQIMAEWLREHGLHVVEMPESIDEAYDLGIVPRPASAPTPNPGLFDF